MDMYVKHQISVEQVTDNLKRPIKNVFYINKKSSNEHIANDYGVVMPWKAPAIDKSLAERWKYAHVKVWRCEWDSNSGQIDDDVICRQGTIWMTIQMETRRIVHSAMNGAHIWRP